MTTHATKKLHRNIAIAFDFDDTLAPDTMSGLLAQRGEDVDAFWNDRVHPMVDRGWDPVPAALFGLVELSRERDEPITRDDLVAYGQSLDFFDGVDDTLTRLRERASELVDDVQVDLFVISAGIGDIVRNIPLADRFRAIWACELHYDDRGHIDFVKRLVSHTEKTRYLYRIAHGFIDERPDRSFDVHYEPPDEELHVPFDQMIYVGDGLTDVPCFSVLNGKGGIGLGVFKESTEKHWARKTKLSRGQRVQNLARADFSEDSELTRSLLLGVERICKQIGLQELSVGE